MSGFDAKWLGLREPADHAARNAAVATSLREHFAEAESVNVVDLGCGTGSNLRGICDYLPSRQNWHLVDGDPLLLAEARRWLSAWADESVATDDAQLLHKGDLRISVRFHCQDLTEADLSFADLEPDLITAAALFDLVSAAWLEKLVDAARARMVPIYAVLNYDGQAGFEPADAFDAQVLAAFNRHQTRDKGFGPALGPAAGEHLATLCAARGYRAMQGESPWRLGPGDADLSDALCAGIAAAAAEAEPERAELHQAWARRKRKGTACQIGHMDVFARP